MIKFFGFLTVLFGVCFGLGFIVSWIEKLKGKVGWVEGHKPYGIYEKHIKRPLDYALTVFALIMFWPILLIIAIAVKINMGSPVVFEQERPGLGGRIFKIKKFRTMIDAKDAKGVPLPDSQRLTHFGRILRASSGDEILEALNVLKGELSIVGPRPLLTRYLPAYTDDEKHRHDIRPGLTGLAQVNGRNYCPWDERLSYDIEYVKKITFIGDLRIIVKTIVKVFRRDDVATNTDEIDEGYLDEIRGVSK